MTPGNDFILASLALALAVAGAYAGGRLHQWYRHALERHEAWRDGYDRASGTLFKHAARAGLRRAGEETGEIPQAETADATVTAITDAPSAGRHSFETRHEVTRRITPPEATAV